jgi:hypothetical protein
MVRDLGGHENGGDTTLCYIDPSELPKRLQWLDWATRFDSAEPALDDDEERATPSRHRPATAQS